MNKKIKMLIIVMLAFSLSALAQENHKEDDGHNHKKKKTEHTDHEEEGHKEHEKEEAHGDHDGHSDDKEDKEHAKHDDHKEGEVHSDHDDHGGGKAIGKGKAVEEVDEVKGFKLSKEAIKTLELKLLTVEGDEFLIEKSTLVTSKNTKGVYRFRGGFFKFLPVELKKEEKGKYLVKVNGVDFGDQIVINGTGLLRVADVYSTDSSEYSHAH